MVDHDAFDTLTRVTATGWATRRGLLCAVAGGAWGAALGPSALHDVAAQRKRRKPSHAPRGCRGAYPVQCSPTPDDPQAICFPAGAICCGSTLGGGACPPGQSCCPPSRDEPAGTCAGPDASCCPASAGGGACPLTAPTCCPPTDEAPAGFCSPRNVTCCSFGNIYCAADEDCCPPSIEFPAGGCVPRGTYCPRDGRPRGDDHMTRAQGDQAQTRLAHRRLAVRGQQGHHRPT